MKKKKHAKSTDVSICYAFIHPSNYTPIIYEHSNDMAVTGFLRNRSFFLLRTIQIAAAVGPDSLSSFFRRGAVCLTDAYAPLFNSSLTSSSIPHCRAPVTIIPFIKSGNSTALAKRFHSIALTSSGINLTTCCILRCLCSFVYPLYDPS